MLHKFLLYSNRLVVTLTMVASISTLSFSQDTPPVDYYQGACKLYGTALRTALHNIIDGHTVISYDGLYTAFPSTDTKPNGKIWDIYSDIPGGTPSYEYTHGVKKCGNYSGEGDCYNREHSWPDSWLGNTNPARSDLFHMYPTDGYVNNRRSNYPFGIVGSATWTSTNGSKVGTNTYPGYASTVFEPIDAYKGDLARSMMYMSVRYYTEDSGFGSSGATSKSNLLTWYANLMYAWHIKDTVSTKEINRNNAIFTFQHNRNPFIDHPEFAAEIWQTDLKPQVVKLIPGVNSLFIDFTRYLDSVAAITVENFACDNGGGNPVAVQWGVENDVSKLLLSFSTLSGGTLYSMQLRNLKSINGVLMTDTVITFTAQGPATGIEGLLGNAKGYNLSQNYPNPFNPSTVIKYNLAESNHVTLKIYDVMGNQISTLVDEDKPAGVHSVEFNAEHLSSGVYFYQLRSGEFTDMKKLSLIK
jgi:endonuclease I